jgi:hypothetical protein
MAFWGVVFVIAGGMLGLCLDGITIALTRGHDIPGLGYVLLFIAPAFSWIAGAIGIAFGARRSKRFESGERNL